MGCDYDGSYEYSPPAKVPEVNHIELSKYVLSFIRDNGPNYKGPIDHEMGFCSCPHCPKIKNRREFSIGDIRSKLLCLYHTYLTVGPRWELTINEVGLRWLEEHK